MRQVFSIFCIAALLNVSSHVEGKERFSSPSVRAVETPFKGSILFVPNDGQTHPGVLVLHGSEGGSLPYSQMDALYLASQGFAALAFCWYNCGKDTITDPFDELSHVNLNKTVEALDWLRNSPYVGGLKTGLYGVSRGAEQSLILGWKLAESGGRVPEAIAVHAPSDVVVSGFTYTSLDRRCYICEDFQMGCFQNSDNPLHWDWAHIHWNPSCGKEPKNPDLEPIPAWIWKGTPLQTGEIVAIENYRLPIFISHGRADRLWSYQRSVRIRERLNKANLRPEVHFFENEGHVFRISAENQRKAQLMEFLQRTLR